MMLLTGPNSAIFLGSIRNKKKLVNTPVAPSNEATISQYVVHVPSRGLADGLNSPLIFCIFPQKQELAMFLLKSDSLTRKGNRKKEEKGLA
jgi:hypothetical protein